MQFKLVIASKISETLPDEVKPTTVYRFKLSKILNAVLWFSPFNLQVVIIALINGFTVIWL